MIRLLPVLFFSLLASFSLYAQWDVVDEVFVPPTYYVGDSVLLQFRLVWEDEKELSVPEILPRADWLEIESIDVEQEGYEAQVSIRFKSYMTGTRSLPPVNLGDITIESMKIFTNSLVEQEKVRELRGIRPNLNFSGIKLLIPLFLIILICSPYVCFLAGRFLAERIRILFRWLSHSGPRRRMSRLIKRLESRVDENGKERNFYIDISEGVRAYLSERTGLDCHSMTTRDLKNLPHPPVDGTVWNDISDLLRTADLVKFAGEHISRKERVRSLEVMKEFLASLEREEKIADL